MIDFDLLLVHLGGMGKYQVIICLMIAYFGIPSGLNTLAAVFISYPPPFRCLMNPFDNETAYPNISYSTILNATTPLDNDGEPVDACVRYSYDTSPCLERLDLSCVNHSAKTIRCNEYIFDKSTLFPHTTVSEFQLVCGRRVLDTVSSSMYIAGLFFGALCFGNMSDMLGRRVAAIICGYGILIVMLGVTYSNTVELFTVARCLTAAFAMGEWIALFSHIMEIVDRRWRTAVGVGFQIAFALGYMLWAPIAYLYRDWRSMMLASLVLSAPWAIIVLIVPESPRWLFTNGKEKKGKKVTEMMAKLNKVELSEALWNEVEISAGKPQEKHSTLELFRHRGTRILSFKMAYIWPVISMVYYGLSLNAGSLAGDIFLNITYSGLFEIAGYVVTLLIMDRIGRRLLLAISLIAAGVALVLSTVVNEYAGDNEGLITTGLVFAFVGKACISASFAVIYNFTGELYPTAIRSNSIGFGAMVARIGGVLAPYFISLQDYMTWLPNSIFGVFSISGGLIALTLRDTTGKPMMETLYEAEIFYAGGDLPRKDASSPHSRGYSNEGANFDSDVHTTV